MPACHSKLKIDNSWSPLVTYEILRLRANVLLKIRQFFFAKNILEVDTPLLSTSAPSHPELQPFTVQTEDPGQGHRVMYLQTSPESAMKRLLAAGSGPIYQICKAFRQGDRGVYHNPEFTILEWYRPGLDHHALMSEVEELLRYILGYQCAKRVTYRNVFIQHLGFDPFTASQEDLIDYLNKYCVEVARWNNLSDKNSLVEALMSCRVQPQLGYDCPIFVYDFPASQACMARLRPEAPAVAERFEVYINGLEIANGYRELTDPEEQRERLLADQIRRQAVGLELTPLDKHLLAAMTAGLPDCAGVAVGVDRLIMLMCGAKSLAEVIPFPFERA